MSAYLFQTFLGHVSVFNDTLAPCDMSRPNKMMDGFRLPLPVSSESTHYLTSESTSLITGIMYWSLTRALTNELWSVNSLPVPSHTV